MLNLLRSLGIDIVEIVTIPDDVLPGVVAYRGGRVDPV